MAEVLAHIFAYLLSILRQDARKNAWRANYFANRCGTTPNDANKN
jgi:hypothetical protein